jgi:hypothetical protein
MCFGSLWALDSILSNIPSAVTIFLVAMTPDVQIFCGSRYHIRRWQNQLFKDFCVPSLPNAPQENKSNVGTGLVRER